MAVPTNKAELVSAITTNFDRLMRDFERVPLDRVRETSLDGHAAGTRMSPADLAAYLVGWNELVLKWLERDDRGEPVAFPEAGFAWNELGRLAQKFYADHRALAWPDLLARLSAAKHSLVDTIVARQDDELYGKAWYGKWTKGRMIQFNTSSPYANARGRIGKWLKERA